MSEFLKDTAVALLKEGKVEEFNERRPYNETELFDLSEEDFSSISLEGANLSFVDFVGANFSEVEFNDVNFSESDLTDANFVRAKIVESNFGKAILNGTSFRNAVITFSDFSEADLSGADFSEGDFSDSDFSGSENMIMCKFDEQTIWPDNTNLPGDFDGDSSDDFTSVDEDEPSIDDY